VIRLSNFKKFGIFEHDTSLRTNGTTPGKFIDYDRSLSNSLFVFPGPSRFLDRGTFPRGINKTINSLLQGDVLTMRVQPRKFFHNIISLLKSMWFSAAVPQFSVRFDQLQLCIRVGLILTLIWPPPFLAVAAVVE
jgi:hypothetical protein